MNNLVSAVISTYKRSPEMVKRAAESVLNQTYKDIELIIVDDSPSDYDLRDDVKNMAESLNGNVKYIRHEKNLGACAARNTGIQLANGEFIAFLDDDDEWLPEKIEKQIKKFVNEDVALVYCGNYTINSANNEKIISNTQYHNGYVFDILIFDNFISSCSYPLIRKSVIKELGGFDIKMPAAQDLELWLRIAKKYKIDYVPEPLVNYYIHDGEKITKNHHKKVEALQRLLDLNMDYLKTNKKAYSFRILSSIYSVMYVSKAKGFMLAIKAFFIYPYGFKKMWYVLKCFVRSIVKK